MSGSADGAGLLPAAGRPTGVSRELDTAVGRLWSTSGEVVGSGFLVDHSHLMTCAHVVTAALGRSAADVPTEDDVVTIDFPLAAPDIRVRARVEVWRPIERNESGDVAVLVLLDELPPGLRPARLVAAPDFWGHPFRAFGFPRRHDHGVWATGVLRAAQGVGWVQMEGAASGYAVEGGFSGGAVWDDDLAAVVGMTVAAETQTGVRAAYLIPADTLIATWPALARQTLPPSPYRGLYSFRTQDAASFFGREDLTERLARDVSYRPIVALVGPSGSGKSSVMFAGLLPRLQQQGDWLILTMRPAQATSPLLSLAGAFLDVLEPDLAETERIGKLQSLADLIADGHLPEIVDRVLSRSQVTRILLAVDQFEEIFAKDWPAVIEFTGALLDAVKAEASALGPRFTVVITLRADFLNNALADPALSSALEDSVITIGQMGEAQLRAVIEKPLPAGTRYEAGLVDRILSDLDEQPGSLPLLEFALTLLWEHQERGYLTHDAYERLGGVDGALASYAERVYNEQLLPEDREDARRLFIQLARPSDVGTPVRRLARPLELGQARWRLAQRLAATRLLVADRDQAGTESVELVHEALITGWARFGTWIEVDRDFRAWQERLRNFVVSWEDVKRDPGALLHGVALAEAERWNKERHDDLGDSEKEFIRLGVALRGRSTRRLRIAVVTLTFLLVSATGLGGAVAWLASKSALESRIAASRVLANQVEALSESEPRAAMLLAATAYKMHPTIESIHALTDIAGQYRQLETLFTPDLPGVQNIAFSPTDPDVLALTGTNYVALWSLRTRSILARLDIDSSVGDIEFQPDGKGIIVEQTDSSSRSALSLWVIGESRPRALSEITMRSGEEPAALQLSRDGKILGVCSGGVLQFWEIAPQAHLSTMPVTVSPSDTACRFGFTTAGNIVYLHQDQVVIWDVRTGREISRAPLPKNAEPGDADADDDQESFAAVAPDGRTAFFVSSRGNATWWDLDGHGPIPTGPSEMENLQYVQSATFTRDSRRVVFSPGDGFVVVDVATRRQIGTYRNHAALEGRPSLSADGTALALTLGQGSISVVTLGRRSGLPAGWDSVITTNDPMRVLTLRAGGVDRYSYTRINDEFAGPPETVALPVGPWESAELSPSGRHVVMQAAYSDRTLSLFDLTSVHPVQPITVGRHSNPLIDFGFDPTGDYLATADETKIVVWSVATRSVRTEVPVTGFVIQSIALGPHGDQVAAVDPSGRTLIWDSSSNHPTELVADGASTLSFSPSGRWLAIGTQSGTLLWDSTKRQASPSRGSASPLFAAESASAFSPDEQYWTSPRSARYRDSATDIWSLQNQSLVGSLPFPRVLFLHGNREYLAVADSGIQLLSADPDDALRTVCRVTSDGQLSTQDWDRYAFGLPYLAACP